MGFMAAMAWGYGSTGYGRYRVMRMLKNGDAAERLHSVVRMLQDAGAVAAYEHFGTTARLPLLGPSFGTKFLAFCSNVEHPRALIFDAMVSKWLRENAGVRLVHERWHTRSYAEYLRLVHEWAEALGVRPDDVEFCMFAAEVAKRPGNQWTMGL